MADLSGILENYFATASETFSDNLSGSIASEATTVPVNSAVEYAEGDVVVLTVEPGTANEATFLGVKDSGNQFIDCIWTEGNTAVGHDAGATIIDYDSATHFNAAMKGIQQFANQDGTLIEQAVRDALGLGEGATDGWEVFPYTFTVGSGYNSGNRRYSLTVANQDVRTTLSKGMWLRGERQTAGATQCLDLELASSQYASRADGSTTGTIDTVTDDITIEAWIKPESAGTRMTVFGKRSASVSGFSLAKEGDGRMTITGHNTSVYEGGTTYQCINEDKWTHVAGTLDLSGNSYVHYFNGVSVLSATTAGSGAISAFTNAGDLTIGAYTGGNELFDGKISDVRVWNVVRTATQIKDNMNQQLVGSETNLIGYWKLNGDLNDSTSSANHLSANGGAAATSADTPHGNWYGKIVDVSFSSPNSTVIIQAAEGYDVPNMALTAPYYSVQESPFGVPDRDKLRLSVWEATPAADLLKVGIDQPIDVIKYLNPGTAAGNYYFTQEGTSKKIWGRTAAFTSSGAGSTSSRTVTLPVGFFNTMAAAPVSWNPNADQRNHAYIQSTPSTTTLTYEQYNNTAGTGGVNFVDFIAFGT